MRDWSSDVVSSDLGPLALHDAVAEFHFEALAMEKGARQSHAVIDDQQIALQREGRRRREHHHPVGGRDEGGSRGNRDVGAAMIAARLALIDALRTEYARQDRKSSVAGKNGSISEEIGCHRNIKKKK